MIVIEKKTNKNGVEIEKFTTLDGNKFFVKVSYMNATVEKSSDNTRDGLSRLKEFIKSVDSPEKISDYFKQKTGSPMVFHERKKAVKNVSSFRTKIKRNKKSNQRAGNKPTGKHLASDA